MVDLSEFFFIFNKKMSFINLCSRSTISCQLHHQQRIKDNSTYNTWVVNTVVKALEKRMVKKFDNFCRRVAVWKFGVCVCV